MFAATLVGVMLAPAPTVAADQPIAGAKLALKQVGSKAKLKFLSKDSGFLFPAIGGADDPQVVGAVVDIVPTPGAPGVLTLPAGSGRPGWTAETGVTASYKFDNALAPNGISPVRVLSLQQGKKIQIGAKAIVGVSLTGALAGMSIRITIGTLRNCARFDATTIRRQASGAFVAANAAATALTDCSDASLGIPSGCQLSPFPTCGGPCPGDGVCTAGLGSCTCISPSSPCGGTAPVCNGTCPVGEACDAVGPGFPSCVCLPIGATPCGSPGAPICGGECPSGSVCRPAAALPIFGGTIGCSCVPPGNCGAGGGECANGFVCAHFPLSGTLTCVPISCGGTYPTCGGGPCGDGGTCDAIKITGTPITFCACAVPGSCDSSCGGYTCAPGQVCSVAVGTPDTCSCTLP